jgi:hypothetical protein
VTNRRQSHALRGSLDLLVLEALSLQSMHGWEISQRVQRIWDGALLPGAELDNRRRFVTGLEAVLRTS